MPGYTDQHLISELNKTKELVEVLQALSKNNSESRLSHTEACLIRYAHEVVAKGTAMYEANQAAASARNQHQPAGDSRVGTWVYTLGTLRRDSRRLNQTKQTHDNSSIRSGKETHDMSARNSTRQRHQDQDDVARSDSDNDLGIDLVKAALETGARAFERQQWHEAESLLYEAFQILQHMTTRSSRSFDIFDLHYKLSVCTFYTHEPLAAEKALTGLIEQPTDSDLQRTQACHATHLLSQLYIRIGHVDRAKIECENTLQARRRLLGKQSHASLESLALMAHIYVMLDNRALAKSCLAMIPEDERETILANVEASLGPSVEHLDFTSLLTPSMPKSSPRHTFEIRSVRNEASAPPVGLGVNSYTYETPSTATSLPAASPWLFTHTPTLASLSLADGRRMSTATEGTKITEEYSASPIQPRPALADLVERPQANGNIRSGPLSRKEILEKVGCHPRDQIEEAVCEGDLSTLVSLLHKKKGFWRSSMRKRVRPERVTALHFAALFGATDMARRLIDSNFSVNEIPYGYSTNLTPLHFAVGARQVDMVEFLITNGAQPSEPDTWSTLAGQLMSRSWLSKTMSEGDRDFVPHRIMAVMGILIKQGWNLDEPIDASGKTVLLQAVSFWTGSYHWDMHLRNSITTYLCEKGADPFRTNNEGKTPYDLTMESGHQDLLLILDRGSRRKKMDDRVAHLVELPS